MVDTRCRVDGQGEEQGGGAHLNLHLLLLCRRLLLQLLRCLVLLLLLLHLLLLLIVHAVEQAAQQLPAQALQAQRSRRH